MGRRKRDEHSENAHKIQTVIADKPPGKAKAGRKSTKVEFSLYQALRTRGEGPYTRRLGKIPSVPPPRNLFD